MHAPLALLLPLVALAHAADDAPSSPGSVAEILRLKVATYERGYPAAPTQIHKHYHLANEQCSGVIEGDNQPCNKKNRATSWLNVTTSDDYDAPDIVISDRLDRIEIHRTPPCYGSLDVNLDIQCIHFA